MTKIIKWDTDDDADKPDDERVILSEESIPTVQKVQFTLGTKKQGLAEAKQYVADLKQQIDEIEEALEITPKLEEEIN